MEASYVDSVPTTSSIRRLTSVPLNPFIAIEYFVDVQDTARLHLALLTRPDIQNERVFAFAAPWNWNSLLRILRTMFPGRKFMDDIPGLEDDPSVIHPAARAEGILKEMGRPGWTGLEESLRGNLEEYL